MCDKRDKAGLHCANGFQKWSLNEVKLPRSAESKFPMTERSLKTSLEASHKSMSLFWLVCISSICIFKKNSKITTVNNTHRPHIWKSACFGKPLLKHRGSVFPPVETSVMEGVHCSKQLIDMVAQTIGGCHLVTFLTCQSVYQWPWNEAHFPN